MTTTVHLVRHGRTAWHRPVRYAGSSDVPLDDVGRAQAAGLARWAAAEAPTSLVCSDLGRARETAQAVTDATGLDARVDPRWREPDFGIAEGRTIIELRAEMPDAAARFVQDPVAHPWPGGEPLDAAARRGREALAAAVAQDRDGAVLVVAHSTLIRLVVCDVLGIPLRAYRTALPRLDPTGRATLLVGADDAVGLLAYNVPPGPPSSPPA